MEADQAEVTRMLDAPGQSEPKAAGELLPLVISELRRLAARKLADQLAAQRQRTMRHEHDEDPF